MKKHLLPFSLLLAGCTLLQASVTPEQAARLGNDLTPVGAIQAGSEDGRIPPWEGGITSWPEGYQPGMHHLNPFAEDQPLYTITAANMEQHAQLLTDGHKAMLAAYPETFRLHIYPTRRSASYPQEVYDATKRNATTARLVGDGDGVAGARFGFPFPIP